MIFVYLLENYGRNIIGIYPDAAAMMVARCFSDARTKNYSTDTHSGGDAPTHE